MKVGERLVQEMDLKSGHRRSDSALAPNAT
jgi:hypothetical protein